MSQTYQAKLVKGKTYYVQGIQFENGNSVEVDAVLADYLHAKEAFEVTPEPVVKPMSKKAAKKEITEEAGDK